MWYLLFKSTKLQNHVRISARLCWTFYKANGQPFPCSFVNSQERSWRKTALRLVFLYTIFLSYYVLCSPSLLWVLAKFYFFSIKIYYCREQWALNEFFLKSVWIASIKNTTWSLLLHFVVELHCLNLKKNSPSTSKHCWLRRNSSEFESSVSALDSCKNNKVKN